MTRADNIRIYEANVVIKAIVFEPKKDGSGTIDFNEFLEMMTSKVCKSDFY